jgi:hypothetical protein
MMFCMMFASRRRAQIEIRTRFDYRDVIPSINNHPARKTLPDLVL